MSADRIDHRGLLADEQMARAMEHQAALLLRGLGLDEPHVGPRDRFADSRPLLEKDNSNNTQGDHSAHKHKSNTVRFAKWGFYL
jgi:hypothetical protein